MKIDKRIQTSRSIYLLEQKIRKYFNERDINPVIFCNNCDVLWPDDDIIDVVLLGTALNDILQTNFFPKKALFRFWVLNEALKSRISNILRIPDSSIGVINRYSLFPREDKLFFPKIESAQFVYSARAITLKNFDLVVKFLEKLSQNQNRKIDLEVYSPSISDKNFLKSSSRVNLIKRGDRGINWVRSVENIRNKFLINFSIDPLDDFNVSTAQWQEAGGAVIAPLMGPYFQLEGENIYFIDLKVLIESFKLKKVLFNEDDLKVNYSVKTLKGNDWPSPITAYKFFEIISKVDSRAINFSKTLNSSDLSHFTERLLLYDSL